MTTRTSLSQNVHLQARLLRQRMHKPRVVKGIVSKLAQVSPNGAAIVDWLQPTKHDYWGGPMNGQSGRQQLIRELLRIVDVSATIETGTYRGVTTQFLWHLTGKPVYSVESERRFFQCAKRRVGRCGDIHLFLADSRHFLQQLADDDDFPKRSVLFYLDAHWGPDLPLRDELLLIARNWKDSIIIIDDFEVPGDSGYGFDNYGEGQCLRLDYLPAEATDADMVTLFPTLPSNHETGACRGCAILVDREREKELLSELPLRHATHI